MSDSEHPPKSKMQYYVLGLMTGALVVLFTERAVRGYVDLFTFLQAFALVFLFIWLGLFRRRELRTSGQ